MDFNNGLLYTLLPGSAAIILYIFYYRISNSNLKTPPGPGFVDLLNLHFRLMLGERFEDLTIELATKYGNLVYCTVMGQRVCLINDADLARKMFDGDTKLQTSDRHVTPNVRLVFFGEKSMTFGNYDDFKKAQRKLFNKAMANSGTNNNVYMKKLKSEQDRLYDQIQAVEGQDIHLDSMVADSLNRAVFLMLKGDLDREDMISNTREVSDMMSRLAAPAIHSLLTTFPFLVNAPGVRSMKNTILSKRDDFLEYILKQSQKLSDVRKCKSFVDTLFYYQAEPSHNWVKEDDIKGIVFSVLAAAILTTKAAALGLILSVMNCPDVAKKIQKEIDDVIGHDREPHLNDKARMPYMEATLLENFRHMALNPFVVRSAAQDFEFEGYIIPKNTTLLMNNWCITKNQDWTDPWRFNPDNFLDENGQVLPASHPKRQKVMPFGLGLRRCPGEGFALNNLFLRMASLLQKYDILPPSTGPTASNNPRRNQQGLALIPPPFKCRAVRRNCNA